MNAREPVVKPAGWRGYSKAIVAGSGGMIVAGMAALDATGILTVYPAVSAAVSVVTAMGVYQIRNKQTVEDPQGTYTIPHPYEPPAPGYSPPVLPPPPEEEVPDA